MIYAVIDAIDAGLLLSCHDISDGGLATTISEMIMGGDADGNIGTKIKLDFSNLRTDKALFSETSGFVFEVEDKNAEKLNDLFRFYKSHLIKLGKKKKERNLIVNKTRQHLDVKTGKKGTQKIIDLPISKLKEAWTRGFVEALE